MRKGGWWTVLLLCLGLRIAAQEEASRWGVPFDFPLYLSGNFGELRPNHFHGGLDIKTQGVEGKPVHSVGDGYVSRISVSPGGYGNALYIAHPDGHTSVYAHLSRFAPTLAAYVKEAQYAGETFEVNLLPEASRFPIKKGEIIAWSGNTGSSGGPHLHLEMRRTATNEPEDPLPFFVDAIRDTRPPRAYSVMFYPQEGKGIVNGNGGKLAVAIAPNGLTRPVTAWGEIGLGLKAYDYMDETANTYGVRSVILYADSTELFRSTVDRFLFDEENRAINGWTDFDEFKRHRSWYMKSFLPPGNRLRMLHAGAERGLLHIDEERDYHLLYLLQDAHGNTSRYRFTIRGKCQDIPPHKEKGKYLLRYDQTNIVQEPGMELVIPKGMLYDNVEADTKVLCDSAAIAYTYQLHSRPIPLHSDCPLSIGIRRFPVADSTKYYLAGQTGNALHYAGGSCRNGWIQGNIRELGSYTVAIDTVPPRIEPVNRKGWERSRTLTFRLSDDQTGVRSYKGKVDGQFVLFTCDIRGRITCRLADTPVERNKRHELEMEATDFCGNVARLKENFYY